MRNIVIAGLRIVIIPLLILSASSLAWAEDYDGVPASPKQPWADFENSEDEGDGTWIRRALLWVPNRLLDFIDIFRVDVGAGPMAGGVIRVSNNIQVGLRSQFPAALRVGLMGRRAPIMLENSGEIGVSPAFQESALREICPGEVGAGLDIGIIGLYGGICIDEVFDFIGGIFFIDLKEDDYSWDE